MNVSLTPQLEQFVQQKVDSGLYGSASEVVRESLRLLQERDRVYGARLKALRAAVDVGRRQLASGRGEVFDRKAVQRLKADGRRLSKRLKKGA